jgi:hypothetical protein
MQYLFLIYGDESKMTPPKNPAEGIVMTAPWLEYTEALKTAGVYQAGAPLQPTSTATTVAAVAGKPEPVFTDGPFAETKEQLGGYYLVDCKNLDEALAWAAKCPGVRYGKVEVRPVAAML